MSRAGRNERFDYAEQLARSWSHERDSVLATLDIWRSWWRDVLLVVSDVDAVSSPGRGPQRGRAVLAAAGAAERWRLRSGRASTLLRNTNAQLALEVMMLDLPVLPEP